MRSSALRRRRNGGQRAAFIRSPIQRLGDQKPAEYVATVFTGQNFRISQLVSRNMSPMVEFAEAGQENLSNDSDGNEKTHPSSAGLSAWRVGKMVATRASHTQWPAEQVPPVLLALSNQLPHRTLHCSTASDELKAITGSGRQNTLICTGGNAHEKPQPSQETPPRTR